MRKPKSEPSLREMFNKYHWLSRECTDALESIAVREEFSPEQVRVRQGEICDYIFLNAKGITRVSMAKNGKADTICFGGVGDVFMSFRALHTGEPALFTLSAVSEVAAYRIPVRKFRNLRVKYQELDTWLANLLIEQIYSFEMLYSLLTLSPAEERLKNFWDFNTDNLRHLPRTKLSRVVPLKILAQYLGMAPQTLSKLRRKYVGK